MIQREVAKRICAQPGTGDYGAFSLLCQYHARCEYLFEVPKECFPARPQGDLRRGTAHPADQPPVAVDNEALFFRVVRAACPARKRCLNALGSAFGGEMTKEQIASCISSCNLPATVGEKKLGIVEFAQLCSALDAVI